MIQVQTYAVYLLLFVVMYILAINTAATKSMKPIVSAMIIYAVLFGIRYGVGRDFISYNENYNGIAAGLNPSEDFEFGFAFMTSSMARLGIPSCVYFGVIAFIQILFVFLAEKKNKNVYPLLVFTFIFSTTWLTFSNGLRQVMAFCFFVYSLKLLEDKKILGHYLMILFGFAMHKSAVLLLLVYPVYLWWTNPKREKKHSNHVLTTAVKLAIIPAAVVFGRVGFITRYLDYMDKLLLLAGYDDYVNNEYYHNFVMSDSGASAIGIGYVVILVINFMIVLYSGSTKTFWSSRRITLISTFFYIGVLVHYIFQSSQLIGRVNMYLYGLGFIMGAYTLYQLKKRRKQWPFLILCGMYLLLFVGFLHKMFDNTTAFYFIWQADLFNA